MKTKTVIITGGGTGGHLWPMVSLADEIKNKYEVVILSGTSQNDQTVIGGSGYKYFRIISGKIHRHNSLWPYLRNIANIIKTIFGIIQALTLLLILRPALIFSKGGYVSIPVIIAGKILKIPIIVHESDLVIGASNRVALRYAKKFCVSFPPKYYDLPIDKVIYSGHILRPGIFKSDPIKLKNVRTALKLNSKFPTILVTGGSQGALSLNKVVAKSLDRLLGIANVIHLSGPNDFYWLNDLKPQTKEEEGRYLPEGYSHDILEYMRLSDLIISRAGSNSLAEIAALKKPAIIVPYRYAAGDHQKKNAEYFQNSGGGVVINQDELSPDVLINSVKKLLADRAYLKQLGENAYNANQFGGVKIIAGLINQIADKL